MNEQELWELVDRMSDFDIGLLAAYYLMKNGKEYLYANIEVEGREYVVDAHKR